MVRRHGNKLPPRRRHRSYPARKWGLPERPENNDNAALLIEHVKKFYEKTIQLIQTLPICDTEDSLLKLKKDLNHLASTIVLWHKNGILLINKLGIRQNGQMKALIEERRNKVIAGIETIISKNELFQRFVRANPNLHLLQLTIQFYNGIIFRKLSRNDNIPKIKQTEYLSSANVIFKNMGNLLDIAVERFPWDKKDIHTLSKEKLFETITYVVITKMNFRKKTDSEETNWRPDFLSELVDVEQPTEMDDAVADLSTRDILGKRTSAGDSASRKRPCVEPTQPVLPPNLQIPRLAPVISDLPEWGASESTTPIPEPLNSDQTAETPQSPVLETDPMFSESTTPIPESLNPDETAETSPSQILETDPMKLNREQLEADAKTNILLQLLPLLPRCSAPQLQNILQQFPLLQGQTSMFGAGFRLFAAPLGTEPSTSSSSSSQQSAPPANLNFQR